MPYIDRVDGTFAYRGSDNIGSAVVKAAISVKRGDFLIYETGVDTVTQALTKSATASYTVVNAGTAATAIAGVALHDAAAGETVTFIKADEATEFLVRILSASGAGAASTTEQADVKIGQTYKLGLITVGTSGPAFYGMSVTTTNPELQLVEKSPESVSTDDYGFVWVKVMAASRVGI